MNENIKHLIPRPKTPVVKPPMYRSVYTQSVSTAYRSNRDGHRTMGHAEVRLDPPERFLKKHTRTVTRPAVDKAYTVRTCTTKRAEVPRPARRSAKTRGDGAQGNVRRTCVAGATSRTPPSPVHRVQDARDGHVTVLNEAGLEPAYVFKKDYGKTPAYIFRMYEEKELATRKETERKRAIKPPLRHLPEEEVKELLNGLKANRAELHKEFLLLPMLTDTVPKMKRKTVLEKQLASLEKDIDLLERNPSIYVRQDA